MNHAAYVGSIDDLRQFRAALCTFTDEARAALIDYELESRRTLDWLLEDRPAYWEHALRVAEERVVQAKIELERRRHERLPGGEPPSCIEERRALERARLRQRYAEEKVEAVRRWGRLAERETTEYLGRSRQLEGYFDAELPQAVALVDRALAALESYLATRAVSADGLANDSGQMSDAGVSPVHASEEPPNSATGQGNVRAERAAQSPDKKRANR